MVSTSDTHGDALARTSDGGENKALVDTKIQPNRTTEDGTFWVQYPPILWDINHVSEFFPTTSMSYPDQLNAITRFCLYLSIILGLVKKDGRMAYIALAGFLLTYLLYTVNRSPSRISTEMMTTGPIPVANQKPGVEPTVENPFMNVLLTDYPTATHPATRTQAAMPSYNNPKVKEKISKDFEHNLYNDVNNVYSKNNSQREYYTTPSTTIPNDQKSFANWLYRSPEKTCKEGGKPSCYQNIYQPYLSDTPFKYKYV